MSDQGTVMCATCPNVAPRRGHVPGHGAMAPLCGQFCVIATQRQSAQDMKHLDMSANQPFY